MKHFSKREARVLLALANAFVPAIIKPQDVHHFWQRPGSAFMDLVLMQQLLEAQPQQQQKEFRQLLWLLGTPALSLAGGKGLKPFDKLDAPAQEALLQKWRDSPKGQWRKAFNALRKLVMFVYYGGATLRGATSRDATLRGATSQGASSGSTEVGGTASPQRSNPNWQALQYNGPLPLATPEKTDSLPLAEPLSSMLHCQVLVVGSGAGGGVVAGELATAGMDVLVVEKGPCLEGAALNMLEADMLGQLYEQRGTLSTTSGAVSLLAGACMGGGTTVNWAGCFDTPDYILEEWAREHDNDWLLGSAFKQSIAAVAKRLNANDDFRQENGQNSALRQGSEALGQSVEWIQRNERHVGPDDFEALGYSGLGDPTDKKQGTLQTYLKDAAIHGARIMAHCQVNRLLVSGGKVVGAEAVYQPPGQAAQPLTIKAQKVVLAAGALHTPALLMRSGLQHEHLGRHLYLHPTVAISGHYPGQQHPAWHGPMMSTVNNTFTRLDGNYGAKLETPPAHPALMAMAMPWKDGASHKALMLQLKEVGSFIVLTRDKHGGRVQIDRQGKLQVAYHLHDYDRRHMLRGLAEGARIHQAAGAHSVHFPHGSHKAWHKDSGPELEVLLEQMPQWGWQPNQFALFSAHQMGTCRMGGQRQTHPVSPSGEFWQVQGLYVADASLFPASSGVNPMLTIMGLAHYVAQGIKLAHQNATEKAPVATKAKATA